MKHTIIAAAFIMLFASSCDQKPATDHSNKDASTDMLSTTEAPEAIVPSDTSTLSVQNTIEIAESKPVVPVKEPLKKGNTITDNTTAQTQQATIKSTVSTEKQPQKPEITEKNVPATATAPAQKPDIKIPPPAKKEPAGPPSHGAFDKILNKYVSADGKVNYKGLKSDLESLRAYTRLLSETPVLESWPRNEKLVYWINAYNAFTLMLIAENYPVTSITKLDGGKPWDVKRISLGGKKYSLNDIENNIIRPQFKEPRIHFAVNCAARSCPPLLNHAWTSDNLNGYLEQQTRKFINDTRFNTIKTNEIKISKIFDWYSDDFDNIIDFLNKYSNTKINAKAKISYLEYNWELNE